MTPRSSAALAALLLLAGCSSSQPSSSALEQARADTYANVARRLYDEERSGSPTQVAARRIAALPQLARALRLGDAAAARKALRRQPVRHAVRARLVVGSQVFADVGLAFVVSGQVHPFGSGADGTQRTIEVSIQDVIGYVRLMNRIAGVQMVVRGTGGHVATLLPAAATSALPDTGSVSISGRRYLVSSFARQGFAGEPLNLWVLAPA